MKKKIYSCDFEATTGKQALEEGARVWGACAYDIYTDKIVHVSNYITDFMIWMEQNAPSKLYFHNLKYDSKFILYYLLSNGWQYSEKPKDHTFNSLITDDGAFYKITITYEKSRKKGWKKVEIMDSLKKIPLPVYKIAKSYGLDTCKGDCDYLKYRDEYYMMTPQEKDYIERDCIVVGKALKIQFEEGLTKLTIGSDALFEFKNILGKNFDRCFPQIGNRIDAFCRKAYKGGYVYTVPEKQGIHFKEKGLVFDVNSLYPSVMKYNADMDNKMPCKMPRKFKFEYKYDKDFPLYIQEFWCRFELKKGKLPIVQIKKSMMFHETEYLTSSKDKLGNDHPVNLVMTNVDLAMFFDHYNVYEYEPVGGYKFRAVKGIFDEYIDKWGHIKETSDGGKRQIAKLYLNNLYGKTGMRMEGRKKIPFIKDDATLGFKTTNIEYRDGVYLPLACFITAYARKVTITAAQKCHDEGRFCYADTDSIHILGTELPNIPIDDKKLGYWKQECLFHEAKYVRSKTYIESYYNDDGEYIDDIKCCGLPKDARWQVTYDNFKVGAEYQGKKLMKSVKGGCAIVETTFKIY